MDSYLIFEGDDVWMLASLQELHFGGCQAVLLHFDGLRSASCATVGLVDLAEATFGYKGKKIVFFTPTHSGHGVPATMLGIVEEEIRTASKRKLEPKLLRCASAAKKTINDPIQKRQW